MKLSRKVMQPRMFFLVSELSLWLTSVVLFFMPLLIWASLSLQFNDALMYTTPVQSGQYKFNSVLSLAGMKVGSVFKSESFHFTHVFLPWMNSDFAVLIFSGLETAVICWLLTCRCCCWTPNVFQVSKPSQEAYQNELNIESVERSFILSARSKVKFLSIQRLLIVAFLLADGVVLCPSQLSYREGRVVGGHRQGDRRLHKEKDNLHIQ